MGFSQVVGGGGVRDGVVFTHHSRTFTPSEVGSTIETRSALTYEFTLTSVSVFYEDSGGDWRFLQEIDPSTLQMSEGAGKGDGEQSGQIEIGGPNSFIMTRKLSGASGEGTILTMVAVRDSNSRSRWLSHLLPLTRLSSTLAAAVHAPVGL